MNINGVTTSKDIDKSILPANLFKRLSAAMIDILCVGVFSLGVYTIGNLIIENTTKYESKSVLQNKRVEHLFKNSGLFEIVEEGDDPDSYLDDKYTAIVTIYTEEELNELSENEKIAYIELLQARFDNLYLNEDDVYTHTSKEKYNEFKSEYDGLFQKDENGEYCLVDNYEFKRLVSFYENLWIQSFELIQEDVAYVNIMTEIKKIESLDKLNLYLSISIVALIFYLVIPLCSRYYLTLGKKLLKLVVIDSASEQLPEKNKIVLRALVLIIGEILLSFELLAIPLLLSFTCACFTKNRNALHDYPTKTKVVLLSDYLIGLELKKSAENQGGL